MVSFLFPYILCFLSCSGSWFFFRKERSLPPAAFQTWLALFILPSALFLFSLYVPLWIATPYTDESGLDLEIEQILLPVPQTS